MNKMELRQEDWDQAMRTLGVSATADEAQIRTAYMEQVRLHPPDREPEMFERIRDAYEMLKDPRQRARRILAVENPDTPLPDLLAGRPSPRRFVGPELWLQVLKEKRS